MISPQVIRTCSVGLSINRCSLGEEIGDNRDTSVFIDVRTGAVIRYATMVQSAASKRGQHQWGETSWWGTRCGVNRGTKFIQNVI